MSVTKEKKLGRVTGKEFYKNYHSIFNIISENQNLKYSDIANILNQCNFETKRGKAWGSNSVCRFFADELKIKDEAKIKKSFKADKASIEIITKIINENSDLSQSQLAELLNQNNIKTLRGSSHWRQTNVSKFMNNKMNVKRVEKGNRNNNKNVSPDMLRFQENILNQLEKIEPKIIPEIDPTTSLIINELTPNDYEAKDLIRDIDGELFTSSLVVSTVFDKERKHINEAIRKIMALNNDFGQSNFRPSSYSSVQNKEVDIYLISKDGFMLLAMGFTGQKAFDFKLQFINKFNEMEKTLREAYQKQQKDLIPRELSAMELMAITLKGFQEQETKVFEQIKQESNSIKKETTEALEQAVKNFDIKIQELDKKVSNIPTASQPTEQLSFIEGNTKLINISEHMQSKAYKEDKLFDEIKKKVAEYSFKKGYKEQEIGLAYNDLYSTFKDITKINLKKETKAYNQTLVPTKHISYIQYALKKGVINELHQVMISLLDNLILESKEG